MKELGNPSVWDDAPWRPKTLLIMAVDDLAKPICMSNLFSGLQILLKAAATRLIIF
jgi:hypothetical protein